MANATGEETEIHGVRYNTRIPAPIYEALALRAKKARRSINSELVVILEDYLGGYDIERTLEAIRDLLLARSGKLNDQEPVDQPTASR